MYGADAGTGPGPSTDRRWATTADSCPSKRAERATLRLCLEQRVRGSGDDVRDGADEGEEEDHHRPPRLRPPVVITSTKVVDEAPQHEEDVQEDPGRDQE